MTEFATANDGVRLAWESVGTGPPVVLVHGFASSRAQNWKEPAWYKTLGEGGYRVVAMDCRGHGESDKPHTDEVFAMLKLSRSPDSDHEQRQIENRCKAELPNYSATAVRDPDIQVDAWSPGTEWKQLDSHAAGCIAHTGSGRVGSIKLGPAFSWNSP